MPESDYAYHERLTVFKVPIKTIKLYSTGVRYTVSQHAITSFGMFILLFGLFSRFFNTFFSEVTAVESEY
jgi:hypothetical protein